MAEVSEILEPNRTRITFLIRRIFRSINFQPIQEYISTKDEWTLIKRLNRNCRETRLREIFSDLADVLEYLPDQHAKKLLRQTESALVDLPCFLMDPDDTDFQIEKLLEIAREIFDEVCQILGELVSQIEEARPPSRP
ncbi:MAG: hypothetical protein V2A63_01740 [Patescibacteria group bacterium]